MSRIKITQHTEANNKQNEDSSAAIRQGERAILCIADGIGGLDAGEIASKYITKFIELWASDKNANQMGRKTTLRELSDLICRLHEDILAIGDEKHLKLGTTLIVGIIGLKKAIFASVGDSRAYVCQGGTCRLVTRDQTVEEAEKNLEEANLSEERKEDIKAVPAERKAHTLTSWIGYGMEEPVPDFYEIDIDEKVDILLCTDGLSNNLTEDDFIAELKKRQSGDICLTNLTNLAIERGEQDNITAVLYRRRKDRNNAKKNKAH